MWIEAESGKQGEGGVSKVYVCVYVYVYVYVCMCMCVCVLCVWCVVCGVYMHMLSFGRSRAKSRPHLSGTGCPLMASWRLRMPRLRSLLDFAALLRRLSSLGCAASARRSSLIHP